MSQEERFQEVLNQIKESWLSDYRTEKASFTHYIE